jgi:hypothetical protein
MRPAQGPTIRSIVTLYNMTLALPAPWLEK